MGGGGGGGVKVNLIGLLRRKVSPVSLLNLIGEQKIDYSHEYKYLGYCFN